MWMGVLGPLEVTDDSGRPVDVGSPKQQALLALLAINANSVLSTDRIIDELWGDEPPTDGRRNVTVYISRLREVLEPERPKGAPGRLIVTEPTGYALRIDAGDIDSFQFERLVNEARRQAADDPESTCKTIDQALELWRDRPLANLVYEEFAQGEIRRLEELHMSALELRSEASIRMSEPGSVLPELERLVTLYPLRERVVGLFMQALAGTGRQTEALRAYRALEMRLAEEVGLEPSQELRRLEERILLQQDRLVEPGIGAAAVKPVGNLPARLTILVGRERELDEVAGLLEGARLLTLTGAGGVGKTSLVIEVARQAAARYSDRVWLVDFSPLRDSVRVAGAVADALGVDEDAGVSLQSSIADALGTDRSLLVFDNCEHVIDVAASLAVELLHAVPELTIMASSRRSLSVDGESVYAVGPLSVPSAGADVAELCITASSVLLSRRAAAASPGFAITVENATDVSTVCRKLDGIPLSIELAASNLRFMTMSEMAESLTDRLLLGGRQRGVPHHRTLRATMQWSYDLLEEAEQDLFDRLGVFVGRFSRSAALAVGAGSDGVSRAAELAVLVDASMIVADVGGRTTSYRMLPTLRDFAVMNLLERGELESMRRVHAEYLAADAANMGLRLVPMGPTRRIEESVSFEDFRAAADWALEVGFTELAMNLFLPLSHHWINGGRLAEAAHWLGRVRQLDVGESMVMWRLQLAAAILDFFAGRNELAEAAFRSLDASALRLTDPAAEAVAKEFVGRVRWRRGDLRGGRDEMAAAAEASLGLIGSAIWLFEGLAVLQLYLGDISRARHTVDRLVTFAEGKDDALATCIALNVQGWLASYEGDLPESIRCFEECRRIAAEQGDWNHEVNARLGLGWVLPGLRRPRQALAQAEAARGLSLDPGNRSKHAESMIVMGQALMDLGDLPRAALSVADGLQTLQGHIQRVDHMTRGLRIAGWIAAAQGRNDLAFRFMTVSDEHHRRMGYSDPPADAVRSRDALASVAQRLGDAERESLAGAAVGVSLADAVREAIGYLSEAAGTEVSVEPRRGDVERVSVQATPWTAST